MRKKASELASDKLGLPKELIMNIPKLSIAGNKELFLENYQNIVEYTDRIIRIKTKDYVVRITGEYLKITQMDADNLFAKGDFREISFE